MAEAQTALICRDKKETYDLFADCSFCPKQYSAFDEFPVFIKPREGQGACLIKSAEEATTEITVIDYVISEYLPGGELMVDCLTDSEGNLCACLPRIRHRLMAGVCVASEAIVASDEILEIRKTISCR